MNLIKGDCLEELKKIPDKSVDFVYTDLPYNQTACKWDQNVIDLDALWVQLKRIAKNDKTPFFFSCTTRFGYKLIQANEKWFRWDLVWKKNRAAGFLNAYKLPMRKHEMIYCFAKKCPEYDVSDHLTGEEVIKKADSNHIFLKEAIGDAKCFQKPHTSKTLKYPLPTSDITTIDIDIDEEQPPSSWCEVNNDEKTGHRTAKPVALMEFLLKYWTKPGWTVLDPTMGSGSMGIACKKMGRKFIGMEMDDDIYKLAQKRVSEAVVPPPQ